jgi:hypothetical protein
MPSCSPRTSTSAPAIRMFCQNRIFFSIFYRSGLG